MPKGIPKSGVNSGRIQKGQKMSAETLAKRSASRLGGTTKLKGQKHTQEHKLKISMSLKGKKKTIEARKNMSEAHKGQKAHNWKGGVTKENDRIRDSLEYRLWRESVFQRDDWTCVWCLVRGGKLQADHIKPFALFPELRFAIDNGRTLCEPCHRTTDTYGYKPIYR